MAKIQDIDIPYLEFAEAAAPGTPASGIVRTYAKADGLMYSKDDAGAETPMASGAANLAGTELDYVAFTSNVSVTATTEAGADVVVTGSSVAYNGSTVVLIEFFAERVAPANDVAGRDLSLYLCDGGTSIGRIAYQRGGSGTPESRPVYVARRLTPSNASHTYSIEASVSGGTGTVGAGAGGNAAAMPGFIRITRISA